MILGIQKSFFFHYLNILSFIILIFFIIFKDAQCSETVFLVPAFFSFLPIYEMWSILYSTVNRGLADIFEPDTERYSLIPENQSARGIQWGVNKHKIISEQNQPYLKN